MKLRVKMQNEPFKLYFMKQVGRLNHYAKYNHCEVEYEVRQMGTIKKTISFKCGIYL